MKGYGPHTVEDILGYKATAPLPHCLVHGPHEAADIQGKGTDLCPCGETQVMLHIETIRRAPSHHSTQPP